VRNAITSILDRYSLADVVGVTLRKMRRDGVPLPYSEPRRAAVVSEKNRKQERIPPTIRLQPVEGMINNLMGDYAI
jgi:hypothetical protein